MCAFKKEERSVFISVTLMTGITGYKTVPTIDFTFCMYVKGPTMYNSDLKERFLSLIVCLFIYFFFFCPFLPSAFLIFFLLPFLLSAFFFHPHFSICIFHPHPPSAGIRSAFYRHPYKILQQIWVRAKQLFFTFYTSHLRRKSTMRGCLYHTDLRQ